MKLVFFGTPQFAVPSLQHLLDHPEMDVVAVVTQPDKPRGRGKKLVPSAVKQVAVAHHLPVWQPRRLKKDADTLSSLRQAEADAFVVVAYGQILSPEILDFPRLGCINGHGSILPKYRGAAPIQWCLYRGETETGMTTMLMDAGMDTGAILLESRRPIALLENAQDLAIALSKMGADLLISTLLQLQERAIVPTPQDDSLATYAPLIQKSDYRLDWSRAAISLHNQIRGFYPNCTTALRGKTLKILATAPLGEAYGSQLPAEIQPLQERDFAQSQSDRIPGTVVGLAKKLGAIVQTGEGQLLLREVQLAGGRPQSGWDFVNGMRLQVGECLTAQVSV